MPRVGGRPRMSAVAGGHPARRPAEAPADRLAGHRGGLCRSLGEESGSCFLVRGAFARVLCCLVCFCVLHILLSLRLLALPPPLVSVLSVCVSPDPPPPLVSLSSALTSAMRCGSVSSTYIVRIVGVGVLLADMAPSRGSTGGVKDGPKTKARWPPSRRLGSRRC